MALDRSIAGAGDTSGETGPENRRDPDDPPAVETGGDGKEPVETDSATDTGAQRPRVAPLRRSTRFAGCTGER